MKQQNEVPKFAHLQYQVLYDLDISIAEYWFLDMVYQLSHKDWCNKRLDNIAYDMNITRRGVIKMRDRLIEKNLLIKGKANRLKTSEKVNKVYFIDDRATQKGAQSSYKSELSSTKSELSTPKINNRITKDYKGQYSENKEKIRQALKNKDFSMLKAVTGDK